jgi:Ca2+:H+ antiporter
MTSDSSRRGSTFTHDPNMGVLRRMTTGLFTPERKVGKAPTYWGSAKAAITSTWL